MGKNRRYSFIVVFVRFFFVNEAYFLRVLCAFSLI